MNTFKEILIYSQGDPTVGLPADTVTITFSSEQEGRDQAEFIRERLADAFGDYFASGVSVKFPDELPAEPEPSNNEPASDGNRLFVCVTPVGSSTVVIPVEELPQLLKDYKEEEDEYKITVKEMTEAEYKKIPDDFDGF